MKGRKRMKLWQGLSRLKLNSIMKCLEPDYMAKGRGMIQSLQSVTVEDYSASHCSSRNDKELGVDTSNIEEAESSLREQGSLTNEEARALMGRLEYQRGNFEAALHVFDGIDLAAIAPKIKSSMVRKAEHRKSTPHSYVSTPMSMHAISLLFEAMFLKAKSLQFLEKYKEAAVSCSIIMDTIESAVPDGLPVSFAPGCKLQEIISKSVELLPELWKLAGYFQEAILSYRRAILHNWNLDQEVTTKVYKEFAIFLLYGGHDAKPPYLRCHTEGSFIPRNNIEEAILLLMILLRRYSLKKVKWDLSIIDHLIFALCLSGNIESLAKQIEELLPGVLDRKEQYYTLALCYLEQGDYITTLNLLKKLLSAKEDPNNSKALLLASKVCAENACYAEEGVSFARRAIHNLHSHCDSMRSVSNCLLGVNLSTQAKASVSDSERTARHHEALEALEKAEKLMKGGDCNVLYYISLENAEQRKLDVALYYAKMLLRLEAGSNLKGWILLAHELSAKQRLDDAEIIIDAALDQTGKWEWGVLLTTKAKIQIAQGKLKSAIETYSNILAILQLRRINAREIKYHKGRKDDKSLEVETWHDLANVYTSMSRWDDAEFCLSKLRMIGRFSTSRWHATGKLLEAKGLFKEATRAYQSALEIDPNHVPSLVSISVCLKQLGDCHFSLARTFLTDALRIDRTNHEAWYNLGILYKAADCKSDKEAAECFHAAAHLQESAPVEPFR